MINSFVIITSVVLATIGLYADKTEALLYAIWLLILMFIVKRGEG